MLDIKKRANSVIIQKVLNKLFSSPASISILRELTIRNKGVTGREVARSTGLTAQTAHNSLANLEALKIIKREFVGRSHYFTLNREHYLFKNIMKNLFESERNFSESLYKKIGSSLSKVCASVILYGSVVRQEETTESDLDICIVSDTKSLVEEKLSSLRDLLYSEYGITLAPYIIKENDFVRRAAQGQSPINEIVKEGKVLSGRSIKRLING